MAQYGQNLSQSFRNKELEDRLQKLEVAVFKSGRSPANLPQQMLLLKDLGVLDGLKKLGLSGVKLAGLLSALLDANKDNIRKHITQSNLPNAEFKTSINYSFVRKLYEETGLTELAKKADSEYTRLSNEELKVKSK